MKFSVIVVCLNPGDKLGPTMESILKQDYPDFDVIVKDGGSKDGSIEKLVQDNRIKLFVEKDTGIYDAMNQAVAHADGDFVIFMNCGDSFYDESVLTKVSELAKKEQGEAPLVIYGNIYNEKSKSFITPAPTINGFTCYRNVPCHQSCIYSTALCKQKPYEPKFKIRADYEHFLWCYYVGKAKMIHLDYAVANYEGGGFSETKENLKRSKKEHEEITKRYMKTGELFKYKMILALTLAPIRRKMAESPRFSAFYHKCTSFLYGKKQK